MQGTVPDLSGALTDRYQQMTFGKVGKVINGIFQVAEVATNFLFMGNISPAKPTDLEIQSQGQRKWHWWEVNTTSALPLEVDDIVIYLGKQFRVMSKLDYTLYGFINYRLINDYSQVGPS